MRRPPNHRRSVIQGLRELADELSLNPGIPVPLVVEIGYHPRGASDEEKRAEVDRIAKLLGVTPEFSPSGDSYVATRRYGAVHYRAITIGAAEMARWNALMSYGPNITTNTETDNANNPKRQTGQ